MSGVEPYAGPDRRERSGPITRAEFDGFTQRLDRRMDKQDELLAQGTKMFERLNTAMFAKDNKNEFESPGVMTAMQKMSSHIDTVCKLGQIIKIAGMSVIMSGAVVGAAKAISALF